MRAQLTAWLDVPRLGDALARTQAPTVQLGQAAMVLAAILWLPLPLFSTTSSLGRIMGIVAPVLVMVSNLAGIAILRRGNLARGALMSALGLCAALLLLLLIWGLSSSVMMLLPFSCAITLAGLLTGWGGLMLTATFSVGGVIGIAVLATTAPHLVGVAPLQGNPLILTVGTFCLVTGVLAVMVYQVGQTLTATLRRAEAANRLKDDFLAIVSHELRTPMTAILGYGQLLQLRPRDAAYTARTLEKMMQSAKAQMQIIEELLGMSQIMTGSLRLVLTPVDLGTVITNAITVVRPAITAKAIHLQVTLPPAPHLIQGDAQRLQQVVWNLLMNAVQFTPVGGTITITLVPEPNTMGLTVTDTGQGISPEFLPAVFEHFRQEDTVLTRSVGGLGLGLALVRHLVTLHGGTVRAASPGLGQGATFTIRLPRPMANSPSRVPMPAGKAALAEHSPTDHTDWEK